MNNNMEQTIAETRLTWIKGDKPSKDGRYFVYGTDIVNGKERTTIWLLDYILKESTWHDLRGYWIRDMIVKYHAALNDVVTLYK